MGSPVPLASAPPATRHPVLDVLRARQAAGSRPGTRADPHHVAVVVEGGGMRGVVSAGMTVGLEQLELRDAFDSAWGTSAGAFSAAALVTGQAALCCSMFYDELTDRRFIDRRRAVRGRGPLISLDYVFDDVMETGWPFAWEGLLDSDIPFHPVATALDDLRAHPLAGLATKEDYKVALRASSAIPVLAGPPVEHAGRRWVDGGIVEPLAFRQAVAAGATHVLVLQTRGPGELRGALPSLTRPLVRRRLEATAPGLAAAVLASAGRYAADVATLDEAGHPALGGAEVLVLRPPPGLGIGRLTQQRLALFSAAVAGAGSVHAALGGELPRFFASFTPVAPEPPARYT